MKCAIYDFETLSLNPEDGVALSMAVLTFDTDFFPLDKRQLLDRCETIKFDVMQQLAVGRKICHDTLNWWRSRSLEAQRVLAFDPVRDKPLSRIPSFWVEHVPSDVDWVITRRATLDEPLLRSLCDGYLPYDWWKYREMVSLLSGFGKGAELSDCFEPAEAEGLIPHIPSHDIVLDVLRLQELMSEAAQ